MLLGQRAQSKGVSRGGLARAPQGPAGMGITAQREEWGVHTGCVVKFAVAEAGLAALGVTTPIGESSFLCGAGSRRERPTC